MSQVAKALRIAQKVGAQVRVVLTDDSEVRGTVHSTSYRTVWINSTDGDDRVLRLSNVRAVCP